MVKCRVTPSPSSHGLLLVKLGPLSKAVDRRLQLSFEHLLHCFDFCEVQLVDMRTSWMAALGKDTYIYYLARVSKVARTACAHLPSSVSFVHLHSDVRNNSDREEESGRKGAGGG